jgi:hypothetical protein
MRFHSYEHESIASTSPSHIQCNNPLPVLPSLHCQVGGGARLSNDTGRESELNTEMTAKTKKEEAILYKCEPLHWMSLPKPLRLVLGWATVLMFGFSFLTVPMCFVFFVPAVWRTAPMAASVALGSVVLSMCLPLKEWYVLEPLRSAFFGTGCVYINHLCAIHTTGHGRAR